MNKTTKTHWVLEAPAPSLGIADAPEGEPRRRTFSGIAYSGSPVSDWDEPIIIDLASLSLPDPCPVLGGHSRDIRLGVASLAVRDGLLACDGYLLTNSDALKLAADADEGFPWELSVHAQPGALERVQAGASAVVNGRTLSGPITVLRQTTIRELSFTPTGVDAATSAQVMASDPQRHAPHPEATAMTPEELSAQVADLTAQLAAVQARAEAAETALAAQAKAARLSAVTGLFASLGRPLDEAQAATYLALPDDAWAQIARDLAAAKPQPSAHLFAEQATGEPDVPNAPLLNLSAIYDARRGKVTQ